MRTFSCNITPYPTPTSFSPCSLPRTKLHPPPSQPLIPMRRKNQCSFGLVAKCAKLNHRPQQEAGEGEEEEWIDVEFGKLVQEKCRERKGVVELLECLEAEAIMGDDQGKNPTDYNRRAQIFDTSSRVFQALKQQDTTTTAPPQSQG